MSGQWIEVCGILYFIPDNSSDLDELDTSDEAQEPESNSTTEYDEF